MKGFMKFDNILFVSIFSWNVQTWEKNILQYVEERQKEENERNTEKGQEFKLT